MIVYDELAGKDLYKIDVNLSMTHATEKRSTPELDV